MRYVSLFVSALIGFFAGCASQTLNKQPAALETYNNSLSWEGPAHPYRKAWSYALVRYVSNNKGKFEQAVDLKEFCPRYKALPARVQINALSEIVIGVAFYESTFKPTSRMAEPSLGTDCVTKKTVHSEGLLQLSYCDKTWAKFCRFDWERDKNLSPQDPNKTIFDPFINLECGVGILANQVSRREALAVDAGNYWSTLKPSGKYGKVKQIKQRMKKSAPYCY